ncbi:DUF805 domain-containing protein [Actinomadura terrae]|uniref:DUF805 domain-containing protein n=1 Tax=Actinomadura terrae TaxID=604353 RepID=UPI001FA6B57A|nr:DUF805 domain-containing protein [Actinomadura terrae]
MKTSVERTFARTFDWSGRASRSEYWWFVLFYMITLAISIALAMTVATFFTLLIWLLVILVPSLGVSVRRFHDIDRSGCWLLVGLVPNVGGLIVIVFHCLSSTPGPNTYGPPDDPAAQVKAHRKFAHRFDRYGDIYLAVGYAALAVMYAHEAGKKVEKDLAWLALRREVMGDEAYRQRLLEVLDPGGVDDLLRLTPVPVHEPIAEPSPEFNAPPPPGLSVPPPGPGAQPPGPSAPSAGPAAHTISDPPEGGV